LGLNVVPLEELDSVSSTSYDYIIVGGGAGGIPLAAALAEDKSLKILLLERGATRDKYPETKVRMGFLRTCMIKNAVALVGSCLRLE
jgi:choline dehydrogenase-like flavoprotein